MKIDTNTEQNIAYFHLPGLFEFYDFYKVFLPLYRRHSEFFYEWCRIGSVYGAPADCLWGGGRVGFGENDPVQVRDLMSEYKISSRLTFSNSLLKEEHLDDRKCMELCRLFHTNSDVKNGIIIHSDLLLRHLKDHFPNLYFVSSTTKVITDFEELRNETEREEFSFVVPDFRFNGRFEQLNKLTEMQKRKIEFLCNECCDIACTERKACYENVSRKSLGIDCEDHICTSAHAQKGYRFSDAMKNPSFIGVSDIQSTYLPMGFSQFKIEGRSLGTALLLEFILHYLTKPEHQLEVREELYLDSSLDLF